MTPRNELPPRIRVRIRLLEMGLTQKDLAREIGVHHGTIRNLLGGFLKSRPTAQRINNYFGEEMITVPPKVKPKIIKSKANSHGKIT